MSSLFFKYIRIEALLKGDAQDEKQKPTYHSTLGSWLKTWSRLPEAKFPMTITH